MESHSARPRFFASSMFPLDGVRDGSVARPLPTSSERLERNAPRQLMVRGTWDKVSAYRNGDIL
jgi:hypothetical protein